MQLLSPNVFSKPPEELPIELTIHCLPPPDEASMLNAPNVENGKEYAVGRTEDLAVLDHLFL